MKKKRNFLTFISSLFGVFAICGLSLFSILDHKKDNTKVEAVDNYYPYQTVSDVMDDGYMSDYGSASYMVGDYNLQYVDVFTDNAYEFHLDMRFYFENTSSNQYELYNGTSRGNLFYFSTSFLRSSNLLNSTSSFRLRVLYTEVNPSSVIPYDVGFKIYFLFEVYSVRFGNLHVSQSYQFNYSFTGRIYKNGGTSGINSFSDGSFRYFIIPQSNTDIFYMINERVDINRDGLEEQYKQGYYYGYEMGYNDGQSLGFNDGYETGYLAGKTDGYAEGKVDGYNEGFSADSTAITIMTGIFQVALVPLNFFLGIFNFNILGVNLSSVIQALFTIALTIIVLKMIVGKGGE